MTGCVPPSGHLFPYTCPASACATASQNAATARRGCSWGRHIARPERSTSAPFHDPAGAPISPCHHVGPNAVPTAALPARTMPAPPPGSAGPWPSAPSVAIHPGCVSQNAPPQALKSASALRQSLRRGQNSSERTETSHKVFMRIAGSYGLVCRMPHLSRFLRMVPKFNKTLS